MITVFKLQKNAFFNGIAKRLLILHSYSHSFVKLIGTRLPSFDTLKVISQLIKSKKLEGERKEEQHEQGTGGIMGNMKQKIDAASDAIKQKFTGARESADEEYGFFLLFFSDTFSVVDFFFIFNMRANNKCFGVF